MLSYIYMWKIMLWTGCYMQLQPLINIGSTKRPLHQTFITSTYGELVQASSGLWSCCWSHLCKFYRSIQLPFPHQGSCWQLKSINKIVIRYIRYSTVYLVNATNHTLVKWEYSWTYMIVIRKTTAIQWRANNTGHYPLTAHWYMYSFRVNWEPSTWGFTLTILTGNWDSTNMNA